MEKISRGRRFLHKRVLSPDKSGPAEYVITRVANGVVYYKPVDGGGSEYIQIDDFPKKVVKSWVENRMNEVSPPGFSGTVKAMKKHKDITNPFALAWSMYKKGHKPHYEEMPGKSSKSKAKPKKKKKYKDEDKKNESHFTRWLNKKNPNFLT